MNEVDPRSALAELMLEFGDARPAAANRPVALNDSGFVWYVEHGAIDVLAAEHEGAAGGGMVSPYKHFIRLEAGSPRATEASSGSIQLEWKPAFSILRTSGQTNGCRSLRMPGSACTER